MQISMQKTWDSTFQSEYAKLNLLSSRQIYHPHDKSTTLPPDLPPSRIHHANVLLPNRPPSQIHHANILPLNPPPSQIHHANVAIAVASFLHSYFCRIVDIWRYRLVITPLSTWKLCLTLRESHREGSATSYIRCGWRGKSSCLERYRQTFSTNKNKSPK